MPEIKATPSRRAVVATGLGAGALLAAHIVPSHSQTRSSTMEATIRIGSDITTLVNVFTVEPDNQQKLVQLLKEGTETFFSKQPGFISSSVHAGKEGGRAINYSQWRSAADIENFRKDPAPGRAREGRDDPLRRRRGQPCLTFGVWRLARV